MDNECERVMKSPKTDFGWVSLIPWQTCLHTLPSMPKLPNIDQDITDLLLSQPASPWMHLASQFAEFNTAYHLIIGLCLESR